VLRRGRTLAELARQLNVHANQAMHGMLSFSMAVEVFAGGSAASIQPEEPSRQDQGVGVEKGSIDRRPGPRSAVGSAGKRSLAGAAVYPSHGLCSLRELAPLGAGRAAAVPPVLTIRAFRASPRAARKTRSRRSLHKGRCHRPRLSSKPRKTGATLTGDPRGGSGFAVQTKWPSLRLTAFSHIR
jgi:hypothetical protein